MVRAALWRLQQMPDRQREAVLASPAFHNRFSPVERGIIVTLADAWMPPL